MVAATQASTSFFRDVAQEQADFDGERFLLEVDALFNDEALLGEVRWRLEVLHELAHQRGMTEAFEGLRDRLTQIFAQGGNQEEITREVQALTRIETKSGGTVDLRHFLVPERRIFDAREYRDVLARKIANTELHVTNLLLYYPDEQHALQHLGKLLHGLGAKLRDPQVRTRSVKAIEDKIREMESFRTYEALKDRFLRDWLARFGDVSQEALAALGAEEVERLITEHQRHQTTQLVKAGVRPLDTDVAQFLGVHDTLEGEFRQQVFWEKANAAVRRGFCEWILRVVQGVGLTRGQRYAFFQSEANHEQYLLVGVGLPALPEIGDEPIRMVPYLKPFTRKAGYLLEIRRRSLSEEEAYHEELRHYALPFLFGFDQVPHLEVPKAVRNFFNSAY